MHSCSFVKLVVVVIVVVDICRISLFCDLKNLYHSQCVRACLRAENSRIDWMWNCSQSDRLEAIHQAISKVLFRMIRRRRQAYWHQEAFRRCSHWGIHQSSSSIFEEPNVTASRQLDQLGLNERSLTNTRRSVRGNSCNSWRTDCCCRCCSCSCSSWHCCKAKYS